MPLARQYLNVPLSERIKSQMDRIGPNHIEYKELETQYNEAYRKEKGQNPVLKRQTIDKWESEDKLSVPEFKATIKQVQKSVTKQIEQGIHNTIIGYSHNGNEVTVDRATGQLLELGKHNWSDYLGDTMLTGLGLPSEYFRDSTAIDSTTSIIKQTVDLQQEIENHRNANFNLWDALHKVTDSLVIDKDGRVTISAEQVQELRKVEGDAMRAILDLGKVQARSNNIFLTQEEAQKRKDLYNHNYGVSPHDQIARGTHPIYELGAMEPKMVVTKNSIIKGMSI